MFDPVLTTNRIGMAGDGTVYQCTPTGQVALAAVGPGIQYGVPIQMNRGDTLSLGVWEVVEGSVSADIGGAIVRQVIIGG